jgi:hypothetical protein
MKQTAHALILGSLAALLSVSAFADFVRQGAGADTANRYLDSTLHRPAPGVPPIGRSEAAVQRTTAFFMSSRQRPRAAYRQSSLNTIAA